MKSSDKKDSNNDHDGKIHQAGCGSELLQDLRQAMLTKPSPAQKHRPDSRNLTSETLQTQSPKPKVPPVLIKKTGTGPSWNSTKLPTVASCRRRHRSRHCLLSREQLVRYQVQPQVRTAGLAWQRHASGLIGVGERAQAVICTALTLVTHCTRKYCTTKLDQPVASRMTVWMLR